MDVTSSLRGPAGEPAGLGIAERVEVFEREGSVVIPGALGEDEVSRVRDAVDRIYQGERGAAGGPLHLLAFCGLDAAFLELIDHPGTLPLLVRLLGENIFMYHCHLDVHPPEAEESRPWMWHQDGGVINRDLETDPRPRISIKVAFFLSDVSEPGRGNFVVLPGSHLRNRIDRPDDDDNDLPGARPVLARPGDAVLFDRRLWHMRSPNRSALTRKAVFFAYTYRWIRQRDELEIAPELLPLITPVRAQLLGAGDDPDHYWMPDHVELPLRGQR